MKSTLGQVGAFVTLCLNATTGEPLEMVRGRDSRCPDDFFNRFEPEQKEKIKFLGIDRSNAYKADALRHMPHIKVCYDAYHLVSNMNQVLDKIRRFTMRHPSYTLEQFMKGKRYVLLKEQFRKRFKQKTPIRHPYGSFLDKDVYKEQSKDIATLRAKDKRAVQRSDKRYSLPHKLGAYRIS